MAKPWSRPLLQICWLLLSVGCGQDHRDATDAGRRDSVDAGGRDAALARGGAGASGSGGSGQAGDDDAGAPHVNNTDDDAGEPPLHSTPGRTACGSSSCESYPLPSTDSEGQPYCCANGGAFPCGTGNLGACESGNPFYCDEAADCQSGLHCCGSTGRQLYRCQSSCEGQIQLCQTHSECENGLRCTPYVCRGQPMATCGPLPRGYVQSPIGEPPACTLAR